MHFPAATNVDPCQRAKPSHRSPISVSKVPIANTSFPDAASTTSGNSSLGVRSDAEPLHPGEFACLESLGGHPSSGFCIFIRRMSEYEDDLLPLLIAGDIPSANEGEVVSHVEAERSGVTLSGIDVEECEAILGSVADSASWRIRP